MSKEIVKRPLHDIKDQLSPRKYILKKLNRVFDQDDVVNHLMSEYGLSKTASENLIRQTKKYMREVYKSFSENICENNMMVLKEILDESMEEGKYSIAIDVIKELNKMVGIGGNRVTLAQNDKGEQVINITFD